MDLPIDRTAPLVISSLLLISIVLLLWRYRHHRLMNRREPDAAVHAALLAAIDHAPEMQLVGPLRARDTPNAFTEGLDQASRICDQALAASEGKSLALIGCRPGAGTTTVAIAMARRFAAAGQRTLLLDLDFHRPMVQLSTGATGKVGISNLLIAGVSQGVVGQESPSGLHVVGIGNLREQARQQGIASVQQRMRLNRLFSDYERIVIDAGNASEGASPDIDPILARCDLRLLLVDAQHPQDSAQSHTVQNLLSKHRRWRHGTSCLLYNKQEAVESSESPSDGSRGSGNLRSVHAEQWILQQPDERYTLKLTELHYRPLLTRRQVSNYAGHPVACVKLTVLGDVNYLLILGNFENRDQALQAATALGLMQSSLHAVSFADVKKGIRLELRRRAEAKRTPAKPDLPPVT